jgi:hypothetical protein
VAKRVQAAVTGAAPRRPVAQAGPAAQAAIARAVAAAPQAPQRQSQAPGPWSNPPAPKRAKRSLFDVLFGRRPR